MLLYRHFVASLKAWKKEWPWNIKNTVKCGILFNETRHFKCLHCSWGDAIFFSKPDTYLSMLHLFSVTAGPNKPASGLAEDSAARGESVTDLQEVVSLKERMAMYQAAVSRGDCRSFSANVSWSWWFCIRQCACCLPFTCPPYVAIWKYYWTVG